MERIRKRKGKRKRKKNRKRKRKRKMISKTGIGDYRSVITPLFGSQVPAGGDMHGACTFTGILTLQSRFCGWDPGKVLD